MNKTSLILTTILLNILFFSCSTDDNSNPQEPDPTETNKLVKTEKISEARKVDYTYNNDDLLISSSGTFPNFGWIANYTYGTNDRLTIWSHQESGSSTFSDTSNFSYNANGLLSSYTSNSENVIIEYNGNIVTLTGTIEGNSNSEAELELNNSGLIIKFTESTQYTEFEYDSNGNMVTAKSYDNSDNLLLEFTLSYDNKINPFFGQFESIYIERFIEFFWEFEGIFISGFEGYSFPFQKNNITTISRIGGETTTYSYIYDSDNYPTNVTGDTSGDTIIFDIEYY